MSITVDLPPAMAQEAQSYATIEGTSVEKLFLECIAAEMRRRRRMAASVSEFDDLVKATSARRDEPYVFNRADAYSEVMQ